MKIFEKNKFLNNSSCNKLINFFKKNRVMNGIDSYWNKHNNFTNRIVDRYDPQIKKLLDPLHKKIGRLIEKYYGEKQLYLEFSNLVIWEPGSELGPHADNVWVDKPHEKHYSEHRDYSCILYLNHNFKGGEIYFPHATHKIKPKKGKLVFFASGADYVHGVKKIESGNRYTLATWYTRQKQFESKQ
tara:strand:- start:790 stop:1347 length:558 start_codon:yes stop_codon:yes gene_type:complete